MTILDEIAAERRRQIEVEGWTRDHDDLHVNGEMGAAAAAMTVHAVGWTHRLIAPLTETLWPWSLSWWKPKSPRRDLVRAAALLVAEIERLDRLSGIATQDLQPAKHHGRCAYPECGGDCTSCAGPDA